MQANFFPIYTRVMVLIHIRSFKFHKVYCKNLLKQITQQLSEETELVEYLGEKNHLKQECYVPVVDLKDQLNKC